MRITFLLPLTAVIAGVAGCGPQAREQTTGSLPQRDLTLATQTPEVTIASPVETARPRAARRSVRSQRASAVAPVATLEAGPAPVVTPEPVAQPLPEPAPANDRELLPGKTITIIPTSSGPSTGSDTPDELVGARDRTMVTRGGGTCGGRGRGRGRGPGIGIATAPRPDFR